MLVATTYWYYLALARLGRTADANALLTPITPDMDIIENASYHRLLRMYKGELTADSLLAPAAGAGLDAVTTRYGVAAWHLANGRRDQALRAAARDRRRLPAAVAGLRLRRRGSGPGSRRPVVSA